MFKFKSLEDIDFVDKDKNIGIGAFSQVQLIRHVKNDQKLFALKKLFKKDKVEEIYIQREIDLHKDLEHPSIIKFIDYFHHNEYVYIVLEYAENGDLFERMRKKSLTF